MLIDNFALVCDPCIDKLLPSPYNKAVLTLLFWLAEWHALAKLCLHTESTLGYLDASTKFIGQQLHHFCNFTCPAYKTVELPKEAVAHRRRKQATKAVSTTDKQLAEAVGPDGISPEMVPNASMASSSAKSTTHRKQTFNLNTVKAHFLGDYSRTIWLFGTTDSYSTQTVSIVPHCSVGRILKRYTGRVRTPVSEMALWMNKQAKCHQADDSTWALWDKTSMCPPCCSFEGNER